MVEKQFGQRINIELGASLMINIKGIETKLKSHLIGLVPSEFIIIKAPIGHTGIREKLIAGNKVTVRYIQHGHVYGFESFVIDLITKPKTMLVIDYPTKVATASIRKSARHDCYIPCSLNIEGKEYQATIMDFSYKGCRCLLSGLPEQLERKIEGDALDATLKFDAPNDKANIEFSVQIVNSTEYKSASKLGVAFGELEEETEQRLIKIAEYLEK